ncbi:VID27-like protein [Cucumis melo var. makuwa]|uniref:VID27-like protein n=1 Tax=Cucumis melo var. makuwa TaxID=1194695 RepID=A0A5D3CMF2_CUCMM|nr:VID27-like protein [Cucumis melo var. makuwa]
MRSNPMERYPSLSLYYPETDSDSSSAAAGDEMENVCFMWDDEDRDELIEIALDKKRVSSECFQLEEENLIEINISPTAFPTFV